jgi:putative GTP pyrophosphokinase
LRDVHLVRLRQEYHDLRPVAERFTDMMVREMHESVRRNGLRLAVPIESRVKSWTSIEDKLGRGRGFQGASLSELHDFVGIRLILLFQRDVAPTCDLIERLFRAQGRRDRGSDLSVDRFGYQSIHLLARPPDNWLSIPSFAAFRHLEAEVQIRTLAQHMWAAASHQLQYKQEEAVPSEIRRTVHRVSALLETVDLEFERVLAEREAYRATASEGAEDRALNSDLLETVLDGLFPRANKEGFESYSLLFWELDKLGVGTVRELTEIIRHHLPKALEGDRKAVHQLRDNGAIDERTNVGVYFSHGGLLRSVLESEFGSDYYSRIWKEAEAREERASHEHRRVTD